MRQARLRAKFLLAMLAISAGLTSATLWVVRARVRDRARAGLRAELVGSLRAYRAFERQREATLTRAAALIADLPNVRALMTTRDARTIQDASADTFRLSGADLLILAGRDGELEALRSAAPFPREEAAAALPRSLARGGAAQWWFGGGKLYEVWSRPIYFGPALPANLVGYLLVGHAVDDAAARELGGVTGAEAAFRRDGRLTATTLTGRERAAFARLPPGLSAAAGGEIELRLGGRRFAAVSVPLSGGADGRVSLTLLKSWAPTETFLAALNRILIALGALSLLVGGVLAYGLARTITHPLERLVSGVRALAAGDFAFPLAAAGKDEVGELTRAFGSMRESLARGREEQAKLEERLRQSAKMEAVGRLAGGVAHDFNNLLTVIAGNGDLLLGGELNERQRQQAEQVRKASDRAVSLTRQLLAFSRQQVLTPRVLDLNAVVADMGKMLPRLIGEHIEYAFEPAPSPVRVLADPGQIEQVILNLAVNARDAMPGGGRLVASVRSVELDAAAAAQLPPLAPGAAALLAVADTGHGMDQATQARIFEPFFTTKEVGKGTGLGLATVYGIVRQSGGAIAVESAPGKGATFQVYLPPATGAAAEAEKPARGPAARGGAETILLVEDEPGVRDLARQFLAAGGYTVLPAKDGVEALETARAHHGVIHLLLTDLVMPRMGGLELARRLRAARPALKVLYTTGYSELPPSDAAAPPAERLMQKPYSQEILLARARAALSGEAEEAAVAGAVGDA